jgi:hypothetical protein
MEVYAVHSVWKQLGSIVKDYNADITFSIDGLEDINPYIELILIGKL